MSDIKEAETLLKERLNLNPVFKELLAEKNRRKTEGFNNIKLRPKQKQFVNQSKFISILLGGNRAGKTLTGAWKTLMHCSGEYPDWYTGKRFKGPIRAWAVSMSEELSIAIQQSAIHELARKHWLSEDNYYNVKNGYSNSMLKFKNGSWIKFKFVTQGANKFQGEKLHIAWLDENPEDESVWDEIKMRLIDYSGLLYLTMTPLMPKPDFTYRLWKRWLNGDDTVDVINIETIENAANLSGGVKGIETITSSMTDAEKARRLSGQFYFDDAMAVFDNITLQNMLNAKVQGDYRVEDGERVYSEPIQGHEYILTLDTSENVHDKNAIVIVDRMIGKEAYTYRGTIKANDLSNMVYDLGIKYNTAKVMIEMANNGFAVAEFLKVKRYPNMYYRERREKYVTEHTKNIGWKTTWKSKPLLESNLNNLLGDGLEIEDERIIAELLTYIRNEKGKTGAISPDTDDLAIAYMMAMYYHITKPLKEKKAIEHKSMIQQRIEKLWRGNHGEKKRTFA